MASHKDHDIATRTSMVSRMQKVWAPSTLVLLVLTGAVACTAHDDSRSDSTLPPPSVTASSATPGPSRPPPPGTSLSAPEDVAPATEPECFGRPATRVGTEGADQMTGGPGRDVLVTLGGDDLITGMEGRDVVCAGDGHDRVETRGQGLQVRVDLGSGGDFFRGAGWAVLGGSGDDRLVARAVDRLDPGAGRDLVVSETVKDLYLASCLSYSHLRRGIDANLAAGWVRADGERDQVRGIQCLYGTAYADRIVGSSRAEHIYLCAWSSPRPTRDRNVVRAGAGSDLVEGCGGGDLIDLEDGDDHFVGGSGNDRVYGGDGDDTIHGNDGSDHLVGGNGNDRVNGTFYCDLGSSAGDGMWDSSSNQVYGGNGDDEVTGDKAADFIDGGPGLDNGYGGPPGREGHDQIVSVEQRTSCP